MRLIIHSICRLILLKTMGLTTLWTNQFLMPSRFPAASWLAAFLLLPLLGAAQVQEWAYHEPDHLDHSHVLTWPDWGTDRIIAAVAHTDLGTYNSGTTSSTPQGTSILTRQKDDGTLMWQTKLGSNFLLRLSDMKVIPGTDGEEIALVGHRRLSLTGTFSDRGVLFIVSSVDGSLLHEYSLESNDPQNPVDSRLLGLEFYIHEGSLNLACTGWTGDVTTTGGNHRGLYLRFGYQNTAPPVLLAGWELNSTANGGDRDYLGKAVDIGTGIAVVGSTNPFDFNGDVHQAAMAALFDYDGTPIWGQGYREFIQPIVTDHTVAADIMKVDDGFLLAMNHFAGSGMSLSSFNPTNGDLINTQFVNVPASISTSENIKAFDIEVHPDGGWIVGGYIKDHEWVDTNAVSQKGNIPYFLTGTINAVNGHVMLADMKAMEVPSKGAGETVNNWAYAPYPNDHIQPWVYHPEMMALEADQDPNIDLILTGYRERPFNPNAFNLNIIPTDLAASTGPCDTLDVPYLVNNGILESYTLPSPEPMDLHFEVISIDPIMLGLGIIDCGELMPPPVCSLPTGLMESVTCLSVDIETLGGFTPPMDVQYAWDFGDGTTLAGTNLNHPPIHTYLAAGTYTISMTAYCVFDAATSTTLTRTVTVEDCGDDCTPDNDLVAALNMATSSFCSIEYGLIGSVTPVPGADIAWTLNGSALPSADGQWSPTITGSVEDIEAAYDSGSYTGELCATVTCPDGSSNTQCLSFTLSVEAPDYGLDFWLFCGSGCFGTAGTRSAVSLDMALWDLDEAQYDAEVHFSDGTSYVLNLNDPQSIIKCFPYVPFFKSACLRIYEEGGLAAGDAPCYEVCESDACITVETIPPHLFEQVAPTLGLNPASCTVTATPIPDEVESEVSLMAFDTQYPGGGSLAEFLDAFLDGETFANQVMSSSAASGDYTPAALGEGSGSSSCYQVLEATVSHPVVLHIPDDNGGQLFHAGQPVAPAFVDANPTAVVLSDPRLSLVGALLTDGPVDILAQANQQPQVAFVPVDVSVYSGGVNAWSLPNGILGSAGPGGDDIFTTTPTSADDVCELPTGDLGIQYEHGLLGMVSVVPASLSGNGEWDALFPNGQISMLDPTAAGQSTCPSEFSYLAEFRTTLLSSSCQANGIDDLSGNEGSCTFASSMLDNTDYDSNDAVYQLLATDGLIPAASGATDQNELILEFNENYGDGMGAYGQWTISDAAGTVAASGTIPNTVTEYTESISLPVGGSYVFEIITDCWSAYDQSQIILNLNHAGNIQPIALFPAGAFIPGPVSSGFHIPDGIVIVPPTTPIDTTCDVSYTHELMTPGLQPYSSPGTYVAMENNIQLGYEVFFDGTAAQYNHASVVAALPAVGFGQVLSLSNINAVYDFSAFPNVSKVSFNFFDGAGVENLKVNGHTLLVDEFEFMPTTVAPGVTMSVATAIHPGYQTGLVTLTGNVQKLEVGGQQFYLDDVCVVHDGTVVPIATGSGCTAQCDVQTDFDLLTSGTRYGTIGGGANVSVSPGSQATTSDLVPIYLEPLHEIVPPNQYYNFLGVEPSPTGTGQELWTNNITAQFDIQAVVDVTDTVCIAFRDEGGFENLWINGAAPQRTPNGYGGLVVFDGTNIGGVNVHVSGAMVGGFTYEGVLTLVGDVDKLSIGGQELFLDDLCISEGDGTSVPDITTVGDTTFLDGVDIQLTSLDADGCQSLLSVDLGLWEDQVDSLGISLTDEDGAVAGSVQNLGGGQFLLSGSSLTPLSINLSVFVLQTIPVLVMEIPGISIPICTIDVPCFANAAFAAMDIGNCVAEFNYIGTAGNLDWTFDGVPVPAGNVFTHPIAQPGQLVCVTVTDFNDPNCTDTYCQYVTVECGNDTTQVDSCDVEFTHELMAFGPVAIPGPGATVTSEEGIDLSFEDMVYIDGSTNFGTADIMNAQPEAGDGQVLWLNNISAVYDLTGVGDVEQVKFEFFESGGIENLRINGQTLVDDIDNMGGAALGGANVFVAYNTYIGFIAGEVIITGNVQELAVAGQEFYIDNLCVITADESACIDSDADGICDEDEVAGCTNAGSINYNPNATDDDGSCDDGTTATNDTTEIEIPNGLPCPTGCDHLVDFSTQTIGESWGAITSNPTYPLMPGDFMFAENGIDLYVDRLNNAYNPPTYQKNGIVSSPWWAFGSGQVMHTNNATVTFDLDSIPTDSVCLDFLDLGGYEFLEVNGVAFSSFNGYGELAAASGTMGGVQVQVIGNPIIQTTSSGPSTVGFNGRIVLIGNVDKLEIGGQEFWIDNLCISETPPSATLAEVLDEQGEEGVLELFNLSVEVDSANCQAAVAILPLDLPALTTAELQLFGSETGTYYSSEVLGSSEPPSGSENNDSWIEPVSDVFLVPLPETDEPLMLQLYLEDFTTTLVIEIPGLIPGCGGGIIELPCVVDATFVGFEIECGVVSILAPPAMADASESWTVNGTAYVPTGDPHAFTLTLADGTVTTVCRTVVDPNLPDCEDTFCLTFVSDCTSDTCDYSFTHELMAMGAVPPSTFFTEDHIVMHTAAFDAGLGGPPSIGSAWIDLTAVPGVGDNQVLLLSNTNANYDLNALVNVDQVTLEYFDGAGIENLMINGAFLIAEFGDLAGASFAHGGVDVFITRVAGAGYHYGEVILTGNVSEFAIGGQQFFIDNVCVSAEGVDCTNDTDQDGICDEDEVAGCTNPYANNYDPNVTDDDGSCEDILGCMDEEACNYNPNATSLDPDLPCLYPVPGYNCLGEGIISGCLDPAACNYDPQATNSVPDLCAYPVDGYDCQGYCVDVDEDGTCDLHEVAGCTYPEASNYDPEATEDDGTCDLAVGNACPTDIDNDGSTTVSDLLLLLGSFSLDCE